MPNERPSRRPVSSGLSAADVLGLPLTAPEAMHPSGRNRRRPGARRNSGILTDHAVAEERHKNAIDINGGERHTPKSANRERQSAQAEVKARKTANKVASERAPRENRGRTKDAKDFLIRVLARGPAPAKRIRAAGVASGLGWRTVQRAKTALRIEASKTGMKAGWQWHLPTGQIR